MSAPFIEEVFEFPQPDGSTITVRGTGDQNRARFETLDGRPLVRNAEGYFVEAPVAEAGLTEAALTESGAGTEMVSELAQKRSRWRQRRRTARRQKASMGLDITEAPPTRPTVGDFVGLTLLIDFSDSPATILPAEVERFCNQPGYTGFGNNGSVFDYFRDVSNGQLRYTNVVAPYYRALRPKTYYADVDQPFGKRAQELIREALKHHMANGFNFGTLTADRDGFIQALNVFYAGPRINAWSKGLWPHQSTLSPKPKLPGGRRFADYQITDMGTELTLGTFCHENGHMVCDFPDLYRYKGVGNGVGSYCLMCYGGTGGNAKNPVHVGAYLKNEAGWGLATAATPGANVVLPATGNRFLIHSRSPSEYYIIENRQRAGRDLGLPGDGLAVWYVDEKASNTNPAGGRLECALIQADNLGQLEQGFNYGDPGDLFSSGNKASFDAVSAPSSNWRSGQQSGLKLRQISAPGVTMSFLT